MPFQYEWITEPTSHHIHGLVQERRNSSALAMELRFSCTNPSIYAWHELWNHDGRYYICNRNDETKMALYMQEKFWNHNGIVNVFIYGQEHVWDMAHLLASPISIQEWCWTPFLGILSPNSQMTLKVKVNDPHFQHQVRESQDAYLVQLWWFSLKSWTNLIS